MKIPNLMIWIGISILLYIPGLIFQKYLGQTPYHFGEYAVFLTVYLMTGWKVLRNAVRNIIQGSIFDENFLMTVSTAGAIAIHALPEAAGVMLFYQIGEFFQELSVNRSRKSIKSLLEIRPDTAHLFIDGELETVLPSEVRPGDYVVVKPGEKIPLDGVITEGNSQLDTSMLTGEFKPKMVQKGDPVMAGTISRTGALTIRVEKDFENSSVARILHLVENASSRKAKTEIFMTTFARYYTPAVVLISILIAVLPPLLLHAEWRDWIYRALVILVISCPCALVVSIPLGYFGGIGGASRRGILVKGSNALDALQAVRTIVFDKTGTLTQGVFEVAEIVPSNGFSKDEVLLLAAEAEHHSNHPIAESIKIFYGKELESHLVQNYREIPGYGVMAKIRGKHVMVGNDLLLHRENIEHHVCCVNGTVIHAAIDGVYAGYIRISDRLKDDAKEGISELRKAGVKNIFLLTGDGKEAADWVNEELKLDGYFAELLPEDKVRKMEEFIKQKSGKEKIAFVGDGVNDAPVLALSDVGIAMGEFGSDAAIETADVVLMSDHVSKTAEAIRISKKTRVIVIQNIALAMGIKIVFVGLGALGLATMWEAVFADMGVALLAVLNATRAFRT